MKICENCKREFQNKKDSAKFCSDKCRVQWNRKHPHKEYVISDNSQLLLKKITEIVSEILEKINEKPKDFEVQAPEIKNKIRRSFENYRQLKLGCESEDEWIKLKNEIENADNLSPKQKNILTT